MYKCCWNCINGYKACAKTNAEMELVNASKRFCCASYPVSNRLENPFKKRYCKQFEADFKYRTEPFIDKKEAEWLIGMTAEELLEYWRKQHG